MDAFLLIDKPTGITSHDAVYRVRRAVQERSVGHAGTLDPLASGLLLMGAGKGTRLLEYLVGLPKTYEATFRLGAISDTYDTDGQVTETHAPLPTEAQLIAVLDSLVGTHPQLPPAYSAIKVNGQPAYKAARRGETVTLAKRTVTLTSFALHGNDSAFFPPLRRGGRGGYAQPESYPADKTSNAAPLQETYSLTLSVTSGFYVRSLIRDIGDRLGCGAVLTALRRTSVGDFSVTDATPPETPTPLPLERMVTHLPRIVVTPEEALQLKQGKRPTYLGPLAEVACFLPDGTLIGMSESTGDLLKPRKILI